MLFRSKIPELKDLLAGRADGRKSDAELTCFHNYQGLGLQFAAIGAIVYREAKRRKLGLELDDEKRALHEMAVATRDLETPVGTIAAGTVAAQRFTWEGTVGGVPVITVRVNWMMGDDHLDPAWTLGEERFEVEFDAEPPLACTLDRKSTRLNSSHT